MNLAFLFGLIILGSIQFSTPHFWGADGYLHAYLADLVRHQGFIKHIPQLPFSLFAHRFSDKEYLYHLFAAPFTAFANLTPAIKLFALLNSLIFLFIFLQILKKNQTKPLLPTLFLLLGSPAFLLTLSRPRTMVVSFGLMLLSLHFLSQKKYKLLFALTVFYTAWHTSGPQLSLIFTFLYLAGLFFKTRKINLRPLLFVLPAIAIGFLLHPNFPTNLYFWYLNGIQVPWFATRWGVLELGAEFFPYSLGQYLSLYPLLLPLNLGIYYLAFQYRKKISSRHLLFLLANLAFFFLSFRSQRYAAQSFPLALTTFFLLPHPFKIRKIIPLVSLVLLPLLSLNTMIKFKEYLLSNRIYNGHFEETARVIKEKIPPGATIFHANWSDSQYLLGLAPEYNYLVTLDPIYMYAWDKDLYQKYRHIAQAQSEKPLREIQELFNSSYIHTDKIYFYPFYQQLISTGRVEILFEDQVGALFKINE